MNLRHLLGSGATRFTALIAAVSLLLPAAPALAQTAGYAVPGTTYYPQLQRTVTTAGTPTFRCQLPTAAVFCYGPAQIRHAYGIDALLGAGLSGAGRTIVIVDAFGNPFIASDLAAFDATFGLPAADFQVLNPYGATFDITNADDVGWSGEISLDVQWAHAVAPGAAIRLVLSKSDQDIDIYNATKWAVDHNVGDVISQSFGEAESCLATDPAPPGFATFAAGEHAMFAEAAGMGMTVFASSGDDGAAQPTCDGSGLMLSAGTPASDPLVTAVGGTNLMADLSTGAYQGEVAWNDGFGESGGGFSSLYGRPSYQNGVQGTQTGAKGVPDVAYNAGVVGGVLTHWGVGNAVIAGLSPTDPNVFWIFGGTSAGSPQWSGLAALADQLGNHRIGQINKTLYAIGHNPVLYRAAFHDITSGDNVVAGIGGYSTARGWDPVTGLGTPRADVLVPLLAQRSH